MAKAKFKIQVIEEGRLNSSEMGEIVGGLAGGCSSVSIGTCPAEYLVTCPNTYFFKPCVMHLYCGGNPYGSQGFIDCPPASTSHTMCSNNLDDKG